ncbi:hypothetical protein GP486_006615 [Trichoglossum hirsutum]|uniref:Uncharacterized protein n=1 Tax=Trichoglossum hirsutum TaxID=265104 RepID=A0A9P8L7A9_9PEZI|nr:hypothetical protein GP486_006615 [Trichoglossum hirsutum]
MTPVQEDAFEDTRNSRPPTLRRTIGDAQGTLAQAKRIESPVDGDSDSSTDASDGERYFYGNLSEEDAGSVIGVSIDHVQMRFTSLPLEKAAAIGSVNGDGQPDEGPSAAKEEVAAGLLAEREPDRETPTETATESRRLNDLPKEDHQDALPTPWGSSPNQLQKSDISKSILRESLMTTRPRSSSGPAGGGSKRFSPFSLPSLPKSPSLSSFSFPVLGSPLPFLSTQKSNSGNNDSSRAKTWKPKMLFQESTISPDGTNSPSYSQLQPRQQPEMVISADEGGHLPRRSLTQLTPNAGHITIEQRLDVPSMSHGSRERPRPLRRATSDSSLSLQRSLSGVSSLGDDNRFESIHSLVNSRLKAIRDSFQDSNFTLPSLPSIGITLSPAKFLRGLKPDGLIKKWKPVAPSIAITQTESVSPELPDVHSNPQTNAANVSRSSDNGIDFWLLNALDKLKGDVVIMGGYRGSKLRSAKPPYRRIWIPIKVGLNLRKVDLEVGLSPEDEESTEETVVPDGMLTHIGPVDISRRLIRRLRQCENARNGTLRVWDYGYDWRLSPHLLSKKLIKFIEGLPSNAPGLPPSERGALVIAHSLGGLITRHAVNQRPELFSGVIFAGTPQSCVNILGPLRNGDDVLLSSRVLTAQVNFTMRTSFVLLPEDGRCFIDKRTKEEYPVDFFNVETWIEHCFSPCVAPPLPPLGSMTSSLGSLVGSMSGSLSSLPSSLKIRRDSSPERLGGSTLRVDMHNTSASDAANKARQASSRALGPQTGGQPPHSATGNHSNNSASTAVTISREDAITYLRRTLAETLRFKQELHHRAEHAKNNAYPPLAVIYGKSVPTLCGARVLGRDGIMRTDAYDDLVFASGDGVCLAREAMLPTHYHVAKGGRVSSDRGHLTLLGDLQGVGRCIDAVVEARRRGVGIDVGCGAHKK